MNFQTLSITSLDGIAHIELNRPDKANAMNGPMWTELKEAFDWLSTSSARVGVLSGRGRHFTAGIDFAVIQALKTDMNRFPPGQQQEYLCQRIGQMQDAISAVERCRKPVLAAIQGACVGGGIDLITACDMRYASAEARFSVKEIDLAIVADVGTLQRLPRLIGEGMARELAYTGRLFDAEEAKAMGLVNQVLPDPESLRAHVLGLAAQIASKSPLAIRGIKDTLNFSRDHSVAEGLAYVAAKNAAILFSPDLDEALAAAKDKRPARFAD